MKTARNILTAFILNLTFSVFEFIGGMLTGSVAIASDAVHDLGDAASIGIAYFLEKKSQNRPDGTHTYGYLRYSVLGSLLTTLILTVGSLAMIGNAIARIVDPAVIHYNSMIGFAVVGVCVNIGAAFVTREGGSLNQKAVYLHMLEDILGWIVVLIGAVVMRFTDFAIIDPLMSIGVSAYILYHAVGNLKEIADLFLEKTPQGIDVAEIRKHICEMDGVEDVHHIHVRSMDGQNHVATMHIVTDGDAHEIKERIREELREHGIGHVTLETETSAEECHEKECHVDADAHDAHGHHHHHHHGHNHGHKHEHHCHCGHEHHA